MTKTEYMLLQHRLSDQLLHDNPFDRFAREGNAYRAYGYGYGIRDAQSIIHDFYQQFGEDTQEVDQ